jgi:hypothetical protein
VRLYYGAKSPEAMAFRERVTEWEAAGIKVVPVFSEKGEGYVQDALAKASDSFTFLAPHLAPFYGRQCCAAIDVAMRVTPDLSCSSLQPLSALCAGWVGGCGWVGGWGGVGGGGVHCQPGQA